MLSLKARESMWEQIRIALANLKIMKSLVDSGEIQLRSYEAEQLRIATKALEAMLEP